jgi:hypothetical protein
MEALGLGRRVWKSQHVADDLLPPGGKKVVAQIRAELDVDHEQAGQLLFPADDGEVPPIALATPS